MRSFSLILVATLTLYANNFEKSLNIVIDKNNNLMWQDNKESAQYKEDITMAKTYCQNLILNGYIDWRMATIKELQTTLDITNKKTTIKKEFQYTTSSKYWSNTEYFADKNKFWLVDFSTAIVQSDNKDKKYTVRCVRDIK